MATIQTRTTANGETRFRVLVRVKGSRVQTKTFRRKTDANRWAQQVEADIRRGLYLHQQEAQRHTFAELVEVYLEHGLERLSPYEQTTRRRQLGWWCERLGPLRLCDLRPSIIVAERRRLARMGYRGAGPVTAATQNRYLACLSAVLSFGVRELEWLESNPVQHIRRLREPRGRVRFLDEDERRRLLEACEASRDPRLYPLVLCAISTGLRQAELLRLRWSDLDRDRGVVVVQVSKNRTRRAVPVPPQTAAVVERLRTETSRPADLVFANHTGQALFPTKPWRRALREAEIADFTFHDCRHTAASYLAMSGATLAEIADILGHKTLQMVKRYAHLSEQHTVAVSRRMADRFLA